MGTLGSLTRFCVDLNSNGDLKICTNKITLELGQL